MASGVPFDAGEEGRGGEVGGREENPTHLRISGCLQFFYLGCVDLVHNVLLTSCHDGRLGILSEFALLSRILDEPSFHIWVHHALAHCCAIFLCCLSDDLSSWATN